MNRGKATLKGVSDILGILKDGRLLAIEVKVGYNKVTTEQNDFINQINTCGGLAFVARSLDDLRRLDPVY